MIYLTVFNSCSGDKSAQGEADQPNIILLFTDDQKWNTIGALGNTEIKTPNLDRIADGGFVFSNAYCFGGNSGAVCIPSRNMLMSGKVFFRFEADKRIGDSLGIERRASHYTNPGWPSIPKSMGSAGYETFYREKSGSANSPDVREQFDHFEDIHMVNALRTGRPSKGIVDDALNFLRRDRDTTRPFFMYLGFPCPHDPRWSAKEFRDLYDPDRLSLPENYKPVHEWDIGDMLIRDECLEAWPRTEEAIRRHLHDYYAVISSMDHDIGRLLDGIESLGLRDNTILVFSSDQGIAIGDHGLMGKQNIYEGSMKVPLIFKGPGIQEGHSDALVYLHDLFPTFCNLAGIEIPADLDGVSLHGIIKGEKSGVRDRLMLAYRDYQRSVRDSAWKLIRYPKIDRTMLFDLANDPHEINNLANDPAFAAKVEELMEQLKKEQTKNGDLIDLTPEEIQPAAFIPPREKPETPFPAGGLAPGDMPESDTARGLNSLEALIGEGTTVSITPSIVKREEFYSFEIKITLGKDGLSPDDSFGIVNGSNIDRWHLGLPNNFWGQERCWQTDLPGTTNYTTVSCSRENVNLRLKVGKYGTTRPYANQGGHFIRSLRERMRFILEVFTDTELKEGDIITIKWGADRRPQDIGSSGVQAPAFATNYYFLPFIYSRLPQRDRDLPIRRGEFLMLPSIKVIGHDAESLHLTCQPLHAVNDVFSIKIAAVDKYGNPAEDFEGELNLYALKKGIELPEKVSFSLKNRGAIEIDNVKVTRKGWFQVIAEKGNISGKSNYIFVSKKPVENKLYFGDMHSHTLDCDGTNDILEHFDYGTRIAGLDFATVSCHAEYFGTAEAWNRYLKETSKANNPGRFVTFYGYEWAGQGHANAYFLEEKDVILLYAAKNLKGCDEDDPPFRVNCISEGMFMKQLNEITAPHLAIAHQHTAYTDSIDDEELWLDEIYGGHMHDRRKQEDRFRGNLEKGLYLGAAGGSDMHRLTIGHLCKVPGKIWPQGGWEEVNYLTAGLQATFAKELSRASLYQGMKHRNTYGTSGARIVLLFSCQGHPMGSQIELDKVKSPKFTIEVGGTSNIDEVIICRYDGSGWQETNLLENQRNDRWRGKWLDRAFTGNGIYYVRIKQQDGENAWSSPIWIN
jgi:arylsulfatase A-like enzyme